MVRIIHTADLHLGIGFAQFSNSTEFEEIRFKDFISNLEFIKEYAIKNKADFLIIAGDVFHNPRPSIQAFNEFSKIVGEVIKNGIHVIICLGNHDSTKTRENLSYLKSYNNIGINMFHLFDRAFKETIISPNTNEKINFIGLPYPHFQSNYSYSEFVNFFEKKLNELVQGNSGDYNIGVGHLYVEGGKLGSEQRIASLKDHPIPLKLFSSFDLVCLGHLHTPQKLGDNVFYSGSIERIDFGEEGEEKSFLDIKIGSKIEANRISLNLRPMRTFYINARNLSHSELIKEIRNLKVERGSIMRLRITISNKASYPPLNQIEKIFKEEFNIAGIKIEISRIEQEDIEIKTSNLDFYVFLEEYLKNKYKDKSKEFIKKVLVEAKEIIEEAQMK